MIRFYKPTLKRRDMDSVLQTMVNEKIGPGERCQYFTGAFAEKVNCRTAVAYRTYPDCIENALFLAGASKGTKVALSILTPTVYKEVLNKLGCEIILLDVDRENGLPDPVSVVSSGAEIYVLYENCGTLPLKYNRETSSVEKNDYSGVTVIEDITQSLGVKYGDEFKPGDFSKIIICAFEEQCIVSSAGGACLAVKEDYATALRNNKPSEYLRLPDLNASLGLVQLVNIDENTQKRGEIFKLYKQCLDKTAHKQFGLNLIDFIPATSDFSVFLNSKPEETIKFAEKHEVPVVMTFENSMIKECEGDIFEMFPVAAAYYHRTVSFPLYPFLTAREIDDISKIIAHLP